PGLALGRALELFRRVDADDARAVQAGAVLAVALRPVERAVGGALQLLRGGGMRRVRGDADADRHGTAGGLRACEPALNLLDRPVARHLVEREEDGELVAAEPERLRVLDRAEQL